MLDTQQQIDTLEKLDTYFLQTGLEMKEVMCICTPIDLDIKN